MGKGPNISKQIDAHDRRMAKDRKNLDKMGALHRGGAARGIYMKSPWEKFGKIAAFSMLGLTVLTAAGAIYYFVFRDNSEVQKDTSRLGLCGLSDEAGNAATPNACFFEVDTTAILPSKEDPTNPASGIKNVIKYKVYTDTQSKPLVNNSGVGLVVGLDAEVDPTLYAQTQMSETVPISRLTPATFFNTLNDTTLPADQRAVNYQVCKNEVIVVSNIVRENPAQFETDYFPAAIIQDPAIMHLPIDFAPHTAVAVPTSGLKEMVLSYNKGTIDCVKPS